MRVYLLWTLIFVLSLYSLRDFFRPACFLVVLMAVYGHPDMPTNVAGIQGLNPWNILMLFCVIGYLVNRKTEKAYWDLDAKLTTLLVIYFLIFIISATRLYFDLDTLLSLGYQYRKIDIVSEYYINRVKWIIPAFLIFVGATSEHRRKFALWAIMISHILVALIVLRRVPLGAISGGLELTQKGLKVLEQAFGWSRVNTAMLLAGGAWAALLSMPYLLGLKYSWLRWLIFLTMSVALALTGGRTGLGAWLVIGGIYSLWRWRKGFLILPIAGLGVISFVPAVQERMLQGIDGDEGRIEDVSSVTSGRSIAWPIVIDKIAQSPWIGYGGLAMLRSGAELEVRRISQIPEGERGFPHPHNAFLRSLMDSGWIGGVPVFALYLMLVWRSISVVRLQGNENFAMGSASLMLLLGLLLSGFGSQDLFPVQGSIAMWAAIALMLKQFHNREYACEQPVLSIDENPPEGAAPKGLWQKATLSKFPHPH